nr:ATP-binding cassette domain-containing protein [Rhizobium leguminosarum]
MAFTYPESRRGVFERFSLKARPGEFVAILGPSGCGKSTLLNLLSGFLRPQSGHITIDGAPVVPEHPVLGYVFQSPNLFPWLSVLENVRFGLRMNRRGSPQEQRAVALHFLRLVGLEEQAHAAVAKSGEMAAERQISLRFGHFSIPYLSYAYPMDETFEILEPWLGFSTHSY